MKRFLSLILTFALMLSVFSTLSIVVHATVDLENHGHEEETVQDSDAVAVITDVALIVDGIEYRNETVAIYNTSEVYLKVYGENLQNCTNQNIVKYSPMFSLPMGEGYRSEWETDESGTFATAQTPQIFIGKGDFTIQFSNDDGNTYQEASTSFIDGGIIECNGNHYDIDQFMDICDSCNEYIGNQNLVLGENELQTYNTSYERFRYIPFVPDETCVYRIYSVGESDPVVYVCNGEFKYIANKDDNNGNLNFDLYIQLDAGKTYYLGFRDIHLADYITVIFEKHEHIDTSELEKTCLGYFCTECNYTFGEMGEHDTSSEQSCMGYLCKWCNIYYGEVNDNHSPDATQTCLGYFCEWCYEYYGEKNDDHRLSDEQTCAGTLCLACLTYIGEGNGEHKELYYFKNICEVCNRFIGTQTFSNGKNTATLLSGHYVAVKFVPTESATYSIYSVSEVDPKIVVYNEHMQEIKSSDDQNDDSDFYLSIDLEKDNTYYLALYLYSSSSDVDVYIDHHSHENLEQFCVGYYCPICDASSGQGNDVHRDGTDEYLNICDDCFEYCGDADISIGKTTIDLELYEYSTIRFVPEKSGLYWIYSESDSDPMVSVLNSDLEDIAESDDINGTEFEFLIELEAGKTYYFEFYDYDFPAKYQVTILYHEHKYSNICLGYLCECGHLYGEPNDNHKLGEKQTCVGYICEYCDYTFGEPDHDEHVWDYGWCYYHNEVEYPDDMICEHSWDKGDCKICGRSHDCNSKDFDEDGICKVCGEDAGFVIIKDGVDVFYEGFTEALEGAVDGDTIIFLESRYFTKSYDVYKDITIDINGYYWIANDEDAMINVYANVTFMDSYGYGAFEMPIIVYEKCKFLNGAYSHIELLNGLKYEDVIYACSYANVYDSYKDTYVNINSIEMDEMEYEGSFVLYNDDPFHVWSDWVVLEEATCYDSALEGICCIYCAFVDITREGEEALGHDWHGVYGEGYKECANCGEQEVSYVFSGEFSRDLVRNFYEVLREFILEFFQEILANLNLNANLK